MLDTNIHILNKTQYMAIKPTVLSIVESYQTDFTTHDKKHLVNRKIKDCILIARTMGTHLYTVEEFEKCAEKQVEPGYSPYLFGQVKNSELLDHHLKGTLACFDTIAREYKNASVFHYNGTTWRKTTIENARELITLFANKAKTLC